MQRSVRTTAAGSLLSLLLPSATVLTACSSGDVIATMGLPTSQQATAHGGSTAVLPGPGQPGGQSDAVVVTDRQRGYLDALRAAGVAPSSDLLALSIGSYVCQSRAAKHDDQEVWDSVLPLVRSDVGNDGLSSTVRPVPSTTGEAANVTAATSDYIRIATERLC